MRYYARSQAPLGNAVLEALLPNDPEAGASKTKVPKQSLGTSMEVGAWEPARRSELGNQRGGWSLGTSINQNKCQ
jgi:hypothetical protein